MARPQPVYVGDGRVLLKTADGTKMFVDARDISIAPHLMLDGVWEEWTERVLRQLLEPGHAVVEVGANVGYFTLIAAHEVGATGSVIAFECDPVLAQIVRDNIEINGLQKIARVDERAASDRDGTATFYATDRHRGNGTLLAGLEQVPSNAHDARAAIDVQTTTLDTALGDARVDLLKIDAEGAETAIFRGAAALLEGGRVATIVAEWYPAYVHAAGDDPRTVLEAFAARGYAFSAIDMKRRRMNGVSIEQLIERDVTELVMRRNA